ncbi:unnamed protein product [Heligmosomoides polygyrus]|uniref:Histidine phosphatase family protein n=1 Tax=Heligmosomoides polygyrus TaxID=6339 RepID=A0A183FLJ9_HELPZ|nr:unnamed protein product [Heligmosomoides polygyrus]
MAISSNSGYPVNVEYQPIIKPSALPTEEPLSDYYERSYAAVKRVLQSHSENQSKGCILIVAHAESLDTCTRQLCGGDPRSFEHFWYLLHQTPYVGCVHVTEDQPFWRFADPPIPPFTQSANSPFDSRQLALPASTIEELIKNKKSKE